MALNLRRWIGALALLGLLAPWPAAAQDAPPVPMPRPADRMPQGGPDLPSELPAAFDSTEDALAVSAAVLAPNTLALQTPEAAPSPATEAIEAIVEPERPPQPVTLVARITDEGEPIPDGLVWRVFETRTDASGDLALAAKSDDARAEMQLAPGNYVVHVAYGRAQTTDTLTVEEGVNEKALVLDAGAMRLNAAITGDLPIPINLLRFDIFSAGTDADRILVAENLAANAVVTLNAGTYHIESHFGEVNAVVRADLRVEPGQMTDATLYHRAAQVSFKLVSEPGGEAIADIDWAVKTVAGDTIYSTIGAFPATVLAEGDYLVLAKRGDTVYSREFQVTPGAPREFEVLTTVY
jgi:hypothetical protein